MANYKEDIQNVELENGTVCRSFLNHAIGAGDERGNRFGVRVFRNGQPKDIDGSVVGYFVRSDGATVAINDGVVNGNEAYITLPDTCYTVEGNFTLTIKSVHGSETVTLRIIDGTVYRTTTETAVDPGTIIPSVEDLIEAIEDAVDSIPPDYSSLTGVAKTNGLLFADANKLKYVHYTDGYYRYYASGEIRPNESYSYSDYIVVIPGTYCVMTDITNPHTTFYDESYTYVDGTLSSSFVIPDEAVYMVVSIPIAEQDDISVSWTDNRITTTPIALRDETIIDDFNDVEWNKTYIFNIVDASSWASIDNKPIAENGVLITIDSEYDHYAARHVYITVSGEIYTRFYAPGAGAFSEWQSQTKKQAGKVGVLYDKQLTNGSASDFTGTFSVVTGGFSITDKAILGKFYSIENRTVTYLCKVSSDSKVAFITAPYTDVSTVDASLVVDVANKTVKLNSFETEACSFLAANHVLAVEMSKHYQKFGIRITDMITGDVFEKEYVNNGSGGAGSGALNPANNVPMQYDYYGCKKVSGTAVLLMRMTVKCDVADVICYGDSITEQEAYYPTNMFENGWTQMLINASSQKVATSGRSGTSVSKITERIKNELPYIPAKFCMVTIGTNGGNTEENLTELVEYIKSLGVVPILNHIPCYNNNGDTTGFRTVNAMIDTVRANTGVKGCNFDLPTSLAYDGQNVNTNMMFLETYSGGATYYHHPNEKGSAAMLAQLRIDVPEVF